MQFCRSRLDTRSVLMVIVVVVVVAAVDAVALSTSVFSEQNTCKITKKLLAQFSHTTAKAFSTRKYTCPDKEVQQT